MDHYHCKDCGIALNSRHEYHTCIIKIKKDPSNNKAIHDIASIVHQLNNNSSGFTPTQRNVNFIALDSILAKYKE